MGTVSKGDVIPVGLPLALFFLWPLTSMTLCAMYGFRKRSSATIDRHTLFRLSVNLRERANPSIFKRHWNRRRSRAERRTGFSG